MGCCVPGESGILSYGEIDHLIQTKKLTPRYNKTSQTMVLTYDDQWIGHVSTPHPGNTMLIFFFGRYENPDTIANKLKYVIKRSMPGGEFLSRTPHPARQVD